MNELIHPALPFALSRAGGKTCEFALDDEGTLTLTGAARSDLFIDPSGESAEGERPDAGFLVGVPPRGDFTLSARVTVPFGSMFDAGVLLVYAGPERFAKACFEFSPRRKPMAVSVVTRGVSDDANAFVVEHGDTLWLRVTRTGRAWSFHTSSDGKWWDMLRYFTLGEPPQERDAVRVGFLAQSPVGDGLQVTFAQIAYAEGAPEDLRDGS
jgi:regulation of enolase protein 1 (concanavalin A-like superfamily)